MKFPKDILVIDFEGVKEPVQVGAILLDKDTLFEKESYCTYIYADLEGYVNPKTGITQAMIDDAPKPAEVGRIIYDKFGSDLLLATFVQNMDINHFQTLMSTAQIDFITSRNDFQKYDFHILDIWPLAYVHLMKQGYTGSMKSEEIFQAFGQAPRGLHDALEDCRITANVLRAICA